MFTFSKPNEETQDYSNRKKVDDLVQDHFSLDNDSNIYFSTQLMTPTLPDKIAKLVNYSDSLRISKTIKYRDIENIESKDEGWVLFRARFYGFKNNYLVSYENFRDGKVLINKDSVKVRKALINFYTDELYYRHLYYDLRLSIYLKTKPKYTEEEKEEIIDTVDKLLNRIGACTLPKKSDGLTINITANFADWFLCSTEESWSSCLDLKSSYSYAYWSGIPGLIGDKSRVMITVSVSGEKNYRGIVAQKTISRAWGILTAEGIIKILNWYPHKTIENSSLNKVFDTIKFEYTDDEEYWESKYPVHLLYDENNKSRFIFQDYSKFKFINNDVYVVSSIGSTHLYIGKGEQSFHDGDLYDLPKSLDDLINSGSAILEQNANFTHGCDECGTSISGEDDEYTFFDEIYCGDCYNELVVYTYNAGNCFRDDCIFVDSENEWYTASYVDIHFVESDHNGEWYKIGDCTQISTGFDFDFVYMLTSELTNNMEHYTQLHDGTWSFAYDAIFDEEEGVYYSKDEWEEHQKDKKELIA